MLCVIVLSLFKCLATDTSWQIAAYFSSTKVLVNMYSICLLIITIVWKGFFFVQTIQQNKIKLHKDIMVLLYFNYIRYDYFIVVLHIADWWSYACPASCSSLVWMLLISCFINCVMNKYNINYKETAYTVTLFFCSVIVWMSVQVQYELTCLFVCIYLICKSSVYFENRWSKRSIILKHQCRFAIYIFVEMYNVCINDFYSFFYIHNRCCVI